MTLPEDTILENRYRIDGVLAYGSHGAVYRAFDISLNMPVALKENFLQLPQQIAQFRKEALILSRLNHPGLPRVSHYFSFEGQQYLVMNFIEGENLWEIIQKRSEPLPEWQALDYIIQICQAVTYLHRQTPPILHRDIKPRNIKITPQNRAMLVDFGIIKQISGAETFAQAGPQGIISQFSSPEQYSGMGVSTASDIYSLGATLYVVLTAQRPPNSVSRLTENTPIKPPHLLNPKVSVATSEAVLHAMQLKPEERPASAAMWQETLQTIFDSLPAAQNRQSITPVAAPLAGPKSQPAPALPPAEPPPPDASANYWLVDSTGAGYPLGPRPLLMGSHPEADITIDSPDVSHPHASVRLEGQRCFVMDEGSAQGTFLNGQRLRAEWYPLNQGDVLIIGPARFYLTSTRPARLAAATPKASPTPAPAPISPQPVQPAIAAPAAPKPRRALWPMLALLLAALVAAGVGGYLWLNSRRLVVVEPNQTATVQAQQIAQAASAATGAAIAQLTAQANTGATEQAGQTAATNLAREIATTPANPTAVSTATATPPGTSATIITTTVTPRPTVTPTATPVIVRLTPTPAGPTLVPLKSNLSVDRFGVQEVIDVDINPKNPLEVYALVKKDGIYKSSNGGAGPWAKIDLDGSSITAFVIDPANPLRMYAPTWNAVLKSTDGGNTWDPKTEGLVGNRVVDVVVIHPANPNVLYAGIGETLVVSANGGESWTSANYGAGLGMARIYAIAIDPFNAGTIYVGGIAAALYKSQDSGQSFVPLGFNTGKGVFSLALHPRQAGTLLAGINAGQAGIIKTENGSEFRSVSTGLLYGGADSAYSVIVYAPGNPSIVYAGTGYESNPDAKGIFKSTDGGETWVSINNGLSIYQGTGFPYYVKSMAVHPANPDIAFAATGSGLYQTTNGGENWVLK